MASNYGKLRRRNLAGTILDYAPAVVTDDRASFVSNAANIASTLSDGGTVQAGGLLYMKSQGATAVTDLSHFVPLGPIQVAHFGDNTNPGTTNMTTPVEEALAYGTSVAQKVHFRPWSTIAIDADARIEFNCPIDFEGCYIEPLNGSATPEEEPYSAMFIATDTGAPLVTGTVANPTKANPGEEDEYNKYLTICSMTPLLDVTGFNKMGYGKIICDHVKLPERNRDSIFANDLATSDAYEQVFAVTRNGVANYPLAVDLSAAEDFDYEYRVMSSNGQIVIENLNFNLDTSSTEHQCILQVERNDVVVRGVSLYCEDAWDTTDVQNRLFRPVDCAWVVFEDITGHAVIGNGNIINPQGCAELSLSRCRGVEGWGATGGNHVNGYYINDCMFNRVDIHAGAFNVRINGTTASCRNGSWALFQYGWGGGFLQINNCTAMGGYVVQGRDDYGNYWFGDWQIDGITIQDPPNPCRLIAIGHDHAPGMLGFSLPLPRSITMDNVQVVSTHAKDPLSIVPLFLSLQERKPVITGASKTDPIVVTSPLHGWNDGDFIIIKDVAGMVEINDRAFIVANKTVNDFELQGEDGSSYTEYSSGGYSTDPVGVSLPN